MRWQANNFHSLLIENWNGEYTVFQPDSGKTHFLNQMSMQLLSFLNQGPESADKIGTYLARQFQQKPDDNFLHKIEKTLYHFDTLGLVKQIK